jgi:putative transposase
MKVWETTHKEEAMTDKRMIDATELVSKVKGLNGNDLLREIVQVVVQEMLEAERDEHVRAGSYERNPERIDIRSGYKPRTLETMVGQIQLRKPQTRDGMHSEILENYTRIDQSVLTMAAEMYARGVSTRKVEDLLKTTIGTRISAQTVSRANERLDQAIKQLREKPLGSCPVLILDGRFDKVREGNIIINGALLIVVGILESGRRSVIDFRAVQEESEATWSDVIKDMKKRGLRDVAFTISDDHPGLRKSLHEQFVGKLWQRCQTHIERNILNRTPWHCRRDMGEYLRDIFNSPDEAEAWRRLRLLSETANKMKRGLGDYIESIVPDGFAVFALAKPLRKRLRTTNLVERINEEIKRRTKVARIFPSFESYERCAGTILVHYEEKWLDTNCRYIDIELLKESIAAQRAADPPPSEPDALTPILVNSITGGANFAEIS